MIFLPDEAADEVVVAVVVGDLEGEDLLQPTMSEAMTAKAVRARCFMVESLAREEERGNFATDGAQIYTDKSDAEFRGIHLCSSVPHLWLTLFCIASVISVVKTSSAFIPTPSSSTQIAAFL